MKRIKAILVGPEFFWALVYAAMFLLVGTNQPPTEAGSQSLEKWWFILSLIVVPSTFVFLAFVPERVDHIVACEYLRVDRIAICRLCRDERNRLSRLA